MRTFLLATALVLAACDTTGDDFISPYTGPEITEADAMVTDPFGFERGWTADVFTSRSEMSIWLEQVTLCGDECSRTVSLRFTSPLNGLPTAVASVIVQQEFLPERRTEETLSIDRVEIQSWGPIYSGVAYPTPHPGASTVPIVFWSTATRVASE
ncbi:hypothetical protein [Rubrivirga sp. IMCC43871]|uniref:hypothetical protein n=1 Tax=Rubrivirga sp. IMCC43871 TaxID=3391575 RepID=UPI00398F993B